MTKLFPDEADVKNDVRKILKDHGWKFWMPAANGFGTQGVADFCALRQHVFLAVETKKQGGKPSTLQKDFLKSIIAEGGFGFVVDPKTLDVFRGWMIIFDEARAAAKAGRPTSQATENVMLAAMKTLQASIYA